MPKLLSKLVRKIPPFRTIYARLDYLDSVRKEQKKQIDECRKTIANEKAELNKLKADLNQTKKDLAAAQKLLTLNDKKIKEQNEILKQLEKKETAAEKKVDSLQKNANKEHTNLDKKFRRQQAELTKDIEYYYYKLLPPDQYETDLKEWYYNKTGEHLDLEHPVTFNEKIQWLKMYDSTPVKTRLADKYLVREWVSEKIGEQYLIPLLGVYDRFEEIDFDALPDKFVIQTNHAYRTIRIVTDKSKFDYAEAKEFFDKAMQRDFVYRAGLQLHYKGINRKLLVEEYLENDNKNLDDYKVYCFDGKPYCIEYITGRNQDFKVSFFDCDWNLMPVRRPSHESAGSIERPQSLELLLSLAKILCEGFSHVRVDFYILNDGSIKFGEMTFTSANGIAQWDPPEYNKIFGDLIKLPTDSDSGTTEPFADNPNEDGGTEPC